MRLFSVLQRGGGPIKGGPIKGGFVKFARGSAGGLPLPKDRAGQRTYHCRGPS